MDLPQIAGVALIGHHLISRDPACGVSYHLLDTRVLSCLVFFFFFFFLMTALARKEGMS